MKLRVISLLVVVIFLFTAGMASAERLKGKGASNLYLSINFDPQSTTTVTCDNGLIVEFTGLRVCTEPVYSDKYNRYWFKAGVLGISYTLGVQGVYVKLTNPTDNIMVVKWSESSFSIGNFSGIPFMPGMKYIDAGNPSATPDTIIPPNKSITVNPLISQVSFKDGNWHQGYAYVRVDNSLKADLYMKILDPQGTSTYCVAESPAIILPKTALKGITIEKD